MTGTSEHEKFRDGDVRLLDLPGLVRDKIYAFVFLHQLIFVNCSKPSLCDGCRDVDVGTDDHAHRNALLLVNHQIRREALPIYFSQTTFYNRNNNCKAPRRRRDGQGTAHMALAQKYIGGSADMSKLVFVPKSVGRPREMPALRKLRLAGLRLMDYGEDVSRVMRHSWDFDLEITMQVWTSGQFTNAELNEEVDFTCETSLYLGNDEPACLFYRQDDSFILPYALDQVAQSLQVGYETIRCDEDEQANKLSTFALWPSWPFE